MKVLFTCADKPTISRNLFHASVLKKHFDYSECVSGAKGYASRYPSILSRLPFKMFGRDFYFVAYMGHFLVPFMRLLSSKPIVYDFYLSLYDVMCNDRKILKPDSFLGRMIYFFEKRSLQKADFVIVDTNKLIETLSTEYGIEKSKFVRVPLTINETNVYPKEVPAYAESFSVLYVGSYIPLHGTPIIIEAAKILQEMGDDTKFLMIGQGPDLQKCKELATQYGLKNIEFKGYMPLAELNDYYNACDINLGLFNSGERANSVVLNKTNDAFRVGRPHLTLETDAMKECFCDNYDIFFVKDIKPQTLAERILEIKRDPELLQEVSKNALDSYDRYLSNERAEAIVVEEIFNKLKEN